MDNNIREPNRLPVPVTARVSHDLTVRFREMSYCLSGVHNLVTGSVVLITHYDWRPVDRIIVSFTDPNGDTRHYLAERTARQATAVN
ncbi:TPA: hypothetical protein ACIVB1_001936 [Salmonella enterica subsp. diarizonae serovar 61:l,v:z35]